MPPSSSTPEQSWRQHAAGNHFWSQSVKSEHHPGLEPGTSALGVLRAAIAPEVLLIQHTNTSHTNTHSINYNILLPIYVHQGKCFLLNPHGIEYHIIIDADLGRRNMVHIHTYTYSHRHTCLSSIEAFISIALGIYTQVQVLLATW